MVGWFHNIDADKSIPANCCVSLQNRHRHHRVESQLGERLIHVDRRCRHPKFAGQDGSEPDRQVR